MDLVVLPAQTLQSKISIKSLGRLFEAPEGKNAHLSDAHAPPFLLPQKLEGALRLIVVLGRDGLEHGLGQLHVAVFVLAVRVSAWSALG